MNQQSDLPMTETDSGKTDAEQYVDSLDREIRPGDVVYDKNDGKFLYVLDIQADTVAAYDQRHSDQRDLLSYAGNQLTGCTLEDTVYKLTHLKKNTTKSAGSGSHYAYPGGRLTRFVPETADEDMLRVQEEWTIELFAALLSFPGSDTSHIRNVIADHYGKELAQRAAELAEARGAAAVTGGGEE